MGIINLFFPQKHHFPDSKYNKNIFIFQYLNSATLLVDDLVESGNVMTQIWKKAITSLIPKQFYPKNILLLGLAGGCNAHLVNRFFPKSHITAVEIDPAMVELGNKFFRLKKVKNIKIIIADALDYVNNLNSKENFDIVMVDCFIGKNIPQKLSSVSFFQKLKNHSRYVLINRLWWQNNKLESAKVFRLLSSRFFYTKTNTYSNVIISLV